MADESFDNDNDNLDSMENEAFLGGGGYVDDDIDVDDDDDDEPLVTTTPRPKTTPRAPQSPSLLKKRAPSSIATSPRAKKPRTDDGNCTEYLLRAAGTENRRNHFVAKFAGRMPDLTSGPLVRMYRDREGTVDGRRDGLEAHKKQQDYYKSYSGRKRMERYSRQGMIVVPSRLQKGMKIEIAPPNIAQQLAEHRKQKMANKMQAFKAAPSKTGPLAGMRDEPEPEAADPPELTRHLDTFTGVFDGKTRNTRYAIMAMNEVEKTVDVVPIDEYAWFTFRADGNAGSVGEGRSEAKKPKKLENRMARFSDRYNAFQVKRDHALGDDSRALDTTEEFASIGIRRKKTAYMEVDVKGEDLDFEQEFDDDDLAQVDKEYIEKPVTRVQGDAEQNAKKLRELIKDEPVSESAPRSPGSESEEEGGAGAGSKQASRAASPSRPGSGSRSPREASGSSAQAVRQGTPMGASPGIVSPSPSRSSRGSTPRRAEVAHLLPGPGVPPTKEQVAAILRVLLKGRSRMGFKDFMNYFEADKPKQKSHMQSILRTVAVVCVDPKRPKKYFISLKPSP